MRVLLDTHILLWWLTDDDRLPGTIRSVVADGDTIVHVSAASIWEISIKAGLGRLDLGDIDIIDEVEANDFDHLAVDGAHAWQAGQLPQHHTDPFDRMLIAQARIEQLLLASVDDALTDYEVALLR